MKLSIALTTYNGSRFLREQLDSIFGQTRVPDEVIVCDDHSTDDTVSILKEYADTYGLKYYVNDTSIGVNANFFRAISLCSGDYICICDQDDVWMKNKIEVLLNEITVINEQDKPIAVSSLRQDVDSRLNPIAPPQCFPTSERWEDTLLNTEQMQGCTLIINRKLANMSVDYYKSWEEANLLMYDVLISMIAAIFGKKRNTSHVLMYYRHHDANVVDKFNKRGKTFWKKVRAMPTYYPFLLDLRIRNLSVISTIVEGQNVAPEIQCFLDKMRELHQTNNILKGLSIIIRLPQITIARKVKIVFLTPIVKTLKIIEMKHNSFKPANLKKIFWNIITTYSHLILPDKAYLKFKFKHLVGYPLNLDSPKSYNEKIQWLKLNDIHPEYQDMVDKATAKDYVASIVGDKYIIPTLGIWNSVDDIEWEKLPNQFVVKATGDSGGVYVCKDKKSFNKKEAIKKLKKHFLNYNFYNLEYPYKHVPHRYIAEEYMEDESRFELKDYKIFCFNGVPRFIFVATGRQQNDTRFDFYDTEFNHLPVTNGHKNADVWPTKPQNFEEMLTVAEKLSKGIPHVRVDLYNCNGKIYFGEMTFFHWSGFVPFEPVEWDYKFGEYLQLPKV